MVYSIELLSTGEDLLAQNAATSCSPILPTKSPYVMGRSPVVSVVYNNQRIEEITGPTPFVDVSTTVERTDSGAPKVWNTKITLTGKIVRGGTGNVQHLGSGIKPVIDGITRLRQLFKCNECGSLSIECGAGGLQEMFAATGVRVVELSFDKSDDNWIFTSDYKISLEYLEPAFIGRYIRDYSDSWNIEQLEDEFYLYNEKQVFQKTEWDNPNVIPQTTQQQTQNNTGANSAGSARLTNINIPKYKVSRTISAVGIPSGTGYCGNPNFYGMDSAQYTPLELDAFINAKIWVEKRAATIWPKEYRPVTVTVPPAQPPALNPPPILWSPLVSGFLYNRVRSTKFDIQAGSYEITDTYLAMPTGISYTENFTIEISTDNKFIHTVSVQGEIEGLAVPSMAEIIQSNINIDGNLNLQNPSPIDLEIPLGLNDPVFGRPTKPIKIPDSMSNASMYPFIGNNRYLNALSGWIYDIKPYLYRRACGAMASIDRTKGYVNPTQYSVIIPPNNPVYSIHGLLNIIPISTTEGHDTRKGKITYNHQFNNKFTIISGALYESVSIDTNGPADVISEAFVLGRQLGPILQDLGSKTSTKKTVSIEVGVVPPGTINGYFLNHRECPLWTGGSVYSTIETLVEGLAPYGDRDIGIFGSVGVRRDVEGRVFVNQDDHFWNPSEGTYSRNVGWTYQPCTNKQSYLDN